MEKYIENLFPKECLGKENNCPKCPKYDKCLKIFLVELKKWGA